MKGLFYPHRCEKGSLKYEVLSELPLLLPLSTSTVNEYGTLVKLLPPVKEKCLNSDEVVCVDSLMRLYFGTAFVKTSMFCTYSSRIKFQGIMYGSCESLTRSSSMVYVETFSADAKPAIIRNFVAVSVLLQTSEYPQPHKAVVFLACVDWLLEHEEKNFFGSPVEVWQRYVCSPGITGNTYIPVVCIKCRCAHVNHAVQFNRTLREEVTIEIISLDCS